ncbi:MAG: LysR family transcriptional regulator [Anaerovoracaceae bacterium]
MDIKYLKTVKEITETGSFSKAAESLSYAQSTITFQVRQLESEFGVRLFERVGGRMVLTEAGRELMPFISRVLESVDDLEAFRRQRAGKKGILTVAAPESIVTYRLQPVLKKFREAAPDVRLRLRCMNCYAIFDQLCGDGTDIAIHYDVGKYPENFETGKLGKFQLTLVGSPDLPPHARDFVTENQKKHMCHIQNDPDALSLKIFSEYLSSKDIELEPPVEVWSIEAIKRSAASGLGVAFLPRFTVEEELRAGTLSEIETDLADQSMTAMYAYRNDRWVSSEMKTFIQILTEEFPKG